MAKRRRYLKTTLTCVGAVALSLLTTTNLYNFDFKNSASEEYNIGNHLMENGRYDEALTRFHRALALRPDMNQVNLNIGNIHMKRGELDSARVYYLAELDMAVDSVRAYNNLSVVERLAGNDSLSLAYGERAVAIKPYFSDAVVNYIIEARKLRLYAPALSIANVSIEINPDNPDLRYYRGVIYFDLGRFDEAMADFRKSLELLNREEQPSFLVASELGSERHKSEDRRKTEAMIYYSLGTIAGQFGMPDSASISLRKALELDPNLIEAKVNLASALTQLGEFDEAEQLSLSVIESGNANPLVWYFVAVSRANAGSIDEAIAAADSALAMSPDFAPAKSLKQHLQR
jgi:tetratricopeptide (TPR) repeat protein